MIDDHRDALAIAAKEYGDLRMANHACERYAGRLEQACENIREVCRLAIAAGDFDGATLDAISALATVRDDRCKL